MQGPAGQRVQPKQAGPPCSRLWSLHASIVNQDCTLQADFEYAVYSKGDFYIQNPIVVYRSRMSENQQQGSGTAAVGYEHDNWKDFSCVTKWEYFINDVAGAAAATTTQRRSNKKLTSYDGRSYCLRRLIAGPNSDNSNNSNDSNDNNRKARMTAGGPATAGDEGDISEFPDIASFFGEEECSLDAWLAPEPSSSSATMSSREKEGDEREFLEDMEAWHLLRSWFGFGDLLCLHEAA
ncbi:unnamed protein product, partial [Ectocarpus sp. 12 AP-2014]